MHPAKKQKNNIEYNKVDKLNFLNDMQIGELMWILWWNQNKTRTKLEINGKCVGRSTYPKQINNNIVIIRNCQVEKQIKNKCYNFEHDEFYC